MSLLTVGGRRRAYFPLPRSASSAPWNSSTGPCVTPTPEGTGATIHPSVVDMGSRWNGYRWWMANTPYPGGNASYENPCIYGSNDRLNWTVPPGLTNPIDPYPGSPWFHSDTELIWDPNSDKLIAYYRLASDSANIYLRAQSSPDGVNWTDHGTIAEGSRSPAVWRAGPSDWRLWTFGGGIDWWSATSPLGPWVDEGAVTLNGGPFSTWHGDVIWHDGQWIMAYSTTSSSGIIKTASSADGVAWTGGDTIFTGDEGGWATTPYRPTLLPSTEDGFVDCWYGAYGSVTGGCATDYVRLPDTLWPAT